MSREPTEDEIKTRAELILARPMSPMGRFVVDVLGADDPLTPEVARLEAIEQLRKYAYDPTSGRNSVLVTRVDGRGEQLGGVRPARWRGACGRQHGVDVGANRRGIPLHRQVATRTIRL